MKRNVKVHKSKEGFKYITYEDNTIFLTSFSDGSGELNIPDINFYSDSGTYQMQVQHLKRMRRILNRALKTLEQIEDPKLYLKKRKKQ